MPSSRGGASYSARRRFQARLARWRRVEPAVELPLLERVVVRQRRAPERRLEVGQRVRRAQEVLPGTAVEHRLEGVAVVGRVDAVQVRPGHRRLVLVEHELLVADGQTTLQPAGGVEVEVHAGLEGGQEADRALVGGLVVGHLGGREVAAAPERHAEPAGQGGQHEQDELGLRGPERRGAGLHRHRRRERAEDDRRAGPHDLAEGHPGQRLGEGLGGLRRDRDRGHRAAEDERRDEHDLVGLGVGLGRAEHVEVPGHRRVGVGQAHDHVLALDDLGTEHEARHLDRVGARGWGGSPSP